jgi:hypothetical protein
VEVQFAHVTEEKAAMARRGVCGAILATATRTTSTSSIYNRTAYWAERMRLMQHWAERIDGPLDVEPAIWRSAA